MQQRDKLKPILFSIIKHSSKQELKEQIPKDIVAGIVVAGVRYYRRQSVLALMGLIFSIAALALYYILRVMMQFSLGWLEPAI